MKFCEEMLATSVFIANYLIIHCFMNENKIVKQTRSVLTPGVIEIGSTIVLLRCTSGKA